MSECCILHQKFLPVYVRIAVIYQQSPLNPAGENMSTSTGIANPNISWSYSTIHKTVHTMFHTASSQSQCSWFTPIQQLHSNPWQPVSNKTAPSPSLSQPRIKQFQPITDPGPTTTCLLTIHINPPWGGWAWNRATRAYTRSTWTQTRASRAWTRATIRTLNEGSSLQFVPCRHYPWLWERFSISWIYDCMSTKNNKVIL